MTARESNGSLRSIIFILMSKTHLKTLHFYSVVYTLSMCIHIYVEGCTAEALGAFKGSVCRGWFRILSCSRTPLVSFHSLNLLPVRPESVSNCSKVSRSASLAFRSGII